MSELTIQDLPLDTKAQIVQKDQVLVYRLLNHKDSNIYCEWHVDPVNRKARMFTPASPSRKLDLALCKEEELTYEAALNMLFCFERSASRESKQSFQLDKTSGWYTPLTTKAGSVIVREEIFFISQDTSKDAKVDHLIEIDRDDLLSLSRSLMAIAESEE